MSVSYVCCMLSGGGLCDGPITRPEKSYRMWCVCVCDLGTSRRGCLVLLGLSSHEKVYCVT